MTVRDALKEGTAELRGHDCPGADAARDAELLLAFTLSATKEDLAMHPDRALSRRERARFSRLLRKRRAHAPMAHLTGWAWFHGRKFAVTKHTLIPRPATETVVEAALASTPRAAMLVDVGTGTGCIAVTCAAERSDLRVIATDLSRRALRTARRNAARHGVADSIIFVRDDLIARTRRIVPSRGNAVIIANLPYLPDAARDTLAPDVLGHEPATALFGGPDGLDPSRRLVDQIAGWTDRPSIDLFFELLTDQVAPLSAYATKKIPGLSAEPLPNAAGMPIGVRLTVR